MIEFLIALHKLGYFDSPPLPFKLEQVRKATNSVSMLVKKIYLN